MSRSLSSPKNGGAVSSCSKLQTLKLLSQQKNFTYPTGALHLPAWLRVLLSATVFCFVLIHAQRTRIFRGSVEKDKKRAAERERQLLEIKEKEDQELQASTSKTDHKVEDDQHHASAHDAAGSPAAPATTSSSAQELSSAPGGTTTAVVAGPPPESAIRVLPPVEEGDVVMKESSKEKDADSSGDDKNSNAPPPATLDAADASSASSSSNGNDRAGETDTATPSAPLVPTAKNDRVSSPPAGDADLSSGAGATKAGDNAAQDSKKEPVNDGEDLLDDASKKLDEATEHLDQAGQKITSFFYSLFGNSEEEKNKAASSQSKTNPLTSSADPRDLTAFMEYATVSQDARPPNFAIRIDNLPVAEITVAKTLLQETLCPLALESRGVMEIMSTAATSPTEALAQVADGGDKKCDVVRVEDSKEIHSSASLSRQPRHLVTLYFKLSPNNLNKPWPDEVIMTQLNTKLRLLTSVEMRTNEGDWWEMPPNVPAVVVQPSSTGAAAGADGASTSPKDLVEKSNEALTNAIRALDAKVRGGKSDGGGTDAADEDELVAMQSPAITLAAFNSLREGDCVLTRKQHLYYVLASPFVQGSNGVSSRNQLLPVRCVNVDMANKNGYGFCADRQPNDLRFDPNSAVPEKFPLHARWKQNGKEEKDLEGIATGSRRLTDERAQERRPETELQSRPAMKQKNTNSPVVAIWNMFRPIQLRREMILKKAGCETNLRMDANAAGRGGMKSTSSSSASFAQLEDGEHSSTKSSTQQDDDLWQQTDPGGLVYQAAVLVGDFGQKMAEVGNKVAEQILDNFDIYST
ncbi:unnamed protein product [Amoebophrya sp. A120]|nr:unnamed protein product [Amoebophrya sp. A120]|eukprot:GSA120T00021014001.1